MRVDPSELVATSDIANLLGVRQSAVSNWQKRGLGFPAPVATVANGKVRLWLRSHVLRWYVARTGDTLEAQIERHRMVIAELERNIPTT